MLAPERWLDSNSTRWNARHRCQKCRRCICRIQRVAIYKTALSHQISHSSLNVTFLTFLMYCMCIACSGVSLSDGPVRKFYGHFFLADDSILTFPWRFDGL